MKKSSHDICGEMGHFCQYVEMTTQIYHFSGWGDVDLVFGYSYTSTCFIPVCCSWVYLVKYENEKWTLPALCNRLFRSCTWWAQCNSYLLPLMDHTDGPTAWWNIEGTLNAPPFLYSSSLKIIPSQSWTLAPTTKLHPQQIHTPSHPYCSQ